jgi:murein DD-endopeptidase / murein LD-carboxypeptidase
VDLQLKVHVDFFSVFLRNIACNFRTALPLRWHGTLKTGIMAIPYVRSKENIASIIKSRVTFYLLGVLVLVQLAARDVDKDKRSLSERILAFKRGGVEKMVNTDRYDIEGVIEYAESLLGTRHVMGGYSTSGIDCSGMVKLAHAPFGVELPHSSHEQARYGTIIHSLDDLKRGDLVFFHSTYKTNRLITHSGIYLGDNKFIHTSASMGVSVTTLRNSGYWQDHYLFATRLAN